MQTLRSLLALRINEAEEDDVPAEHDGPAHEHPAFVSDLQHLVQSFPAKHDKAMKLLWDRPHALTWHDMALFKGTGGHDIDNGPAMETMVDAVKDYMSDGYNIEESIDIYPPDSKQEDWSHETVTWDATFSPHNRDGLHHVFTAYDKKRDAFILGFDAWSDDDESAFNDAFDEAFERMSDGEEHDFENEEHQQVYDAAWKEYRQDSFGFYGLMFELYFEGSELKCEPLNYSCGRGGFFKYSKPHFEQHYPQADLFNPHA